MGHHHRRGTVPFTAGVAARMGAWPQRPAIPFPQAAGSDRRHGTRCPSSAGGRAPSGRDRGNDPWCPWQRHRRRRPPPCPVTPRVGVAAARCAWVGRGSRAAPGRSKDPMGSAGGGVSSLGCHGGSTVVGPGEEAPSRRAHSGPAVTGGIRTTEASPGVLRAGPRREGMFRVAGHLQRGCSAGLGCFGGEHNGLRWRARPTAGFSKPWCRRRLRRRSRRPGDRLPLPPTRSVQALARVSSQFLT